MVSFPGKKEVYLMTAKEFLNQAYRLDQRIQSKIEQLNSLNTLATKATSTLSHMPKNPNKATSTMENTICKIIDLQHEINKDIDRLVDLKTEIVDKILASITPLNSEVDKLWVKEANKRKEEIESDSVTLVDGDEVFKKISQRLKS